MVRRQLALLAALVALAPGASVAGDPPADETPRKSSWSLFDDEEPPGPPLVQGEAGVVVWPYLDTAIRISRKNGLDGKRLDNAEDNAGLPSRWVSPSADLSIGTEFRGRVSYLDLDRQGDFTRSRETVDVGGGRVFADPGDPVRVGMHYTQVDVLAQWDFLRGKTYRIGVFGGARVLRIATRIQAFRFATFDYQSIAVNDWLVSPIGGGQFELEPVPLFTFYANIRFIDWAWRQVALREERAFEMRVGFRVTFIEDVLSAGLDFRFLDVFVNPSDLNGGKNLAQYELEAGGVGFYVCAQY